MDDRGIRSESRSLGMVGAESEGAGQHSLHIVNRDRATVQGVLSVESFDDEEITIETEMGGLIMRGEDLHVKQLDLEAGTLVVEGFVSSCTYAAPRHRPGRAPKGRGGFLERLLK